MLDAVFFAFFFRRIFCCRKFRLFSQRFFLFSSYFGTRNSVACTSLDCGEMRENETETTIAHKQRHSMSTWMCDISCCCDIPKSTMCTTRSYENPKNIAPATHTHRTYRKSQCKWRIYTKENYIWIRMERARELCEWNIFLNRAHDRQHSPSSSNSSSSTVATANILFSISISYVSSDCTKANEYMCWEMCWCWRCLAISASRWKMLWNIFSVFVAFFLIVLTL